MKQVYKDMLRDLKKGKTLLIDVYDNRNTKRIKYTVVG